MNKEHQDIPASPETAAPSHAHQHRPNHHSRKSRSSGLLATLSSVLLFILFPALIAIILTAFVVQSYQVDGQSMETTLQNHDRLIVDKLPRTWSRVTRHQFVPNRGDIIIFNQTGLPDSFYQKQLIKRVIGLPGERVVVKGGHITIYNSAHPKGFNPDTDGKYNIAALMTAGDKDVSLQNDEIYVFGDNRGNSEDSRYFGPVKTNAIVGKLMLRIYPFSNTEVF